MKISVKSGAQWARGQTGQRFDRIWHTHTQTCMHMCIACACACWMPRNSLRTARGGSQSARARSRERVVLAFHLALVNVCQLTGGERLVRASRYLRLAGGPCVFACAERTTVYAVRTPRGGARAHACRVHACARQSTRARGERQHTRPCAASGTRLRSARRHVHRKLHVLLYTAHSTKGALDTREVKSGCELSRLHDESLPDECFHFTGCAFCAPNLRISEPERVHESTTHTVHFTRDSLSPVARLRFFFCCLVLKFVLEFSVVFTIKCDCYVYILSVCGYLGRAGRVGFGSGGHGRWVFRREDENIRRERERAHPFRHLCGA